jgi:molybdate transport system ATP-binding protein
MLEAQLRTRQGALALDLRLDAAPGVVTALFGPSGAGKSTVLGLVAGLKRPEAGRITLEGETLFDGDRRIDVPAERRGVGLMLQEARLFPHLSVAENLRYGARRARSGEGPSLESLVAMLDLGPLLARRPATLSGGEKQRVGLARTLLARPRALLLDEPWSALDAARRAEIAVAIDRVRTAFPMPIVLVTHDFADVLRHAASLALIEDGAIRAAGPIEALTARADLPLLAERADAGVALAAVVEGPSGDGLTALRVGPARFLVSASGLATEARVRLYVRAGDVAIATGAASGLSVRNQIPAHVRAVAPQAAHEALVTLDIGAATLLARVSRSAVSALSLAPGLPVTALVKAVAVAAHASSA